MSRVVVRPLNVLGGGLRPVTAFSDDFNRAVLGPNWLVSYGVTGFNGADAGAVNILVGLAANRLIFNNPAAGGNPANCGVYPLPPLSALRGRTQFAEARFVASTNIAANRSGPAVLQQSQNAKSAGGLDGYSVQNNGVAGQLLLRSNLNGGALSPILVNPFMNYAFGDVIRLSAEWNAGFTQVTLRGSINGALQNTFVDVAPTIGVGEGMPAMWVAGINGLQTDTWDDFACGLGL